MASVVELLTEYAAPACNPPPGRIPANTGTVGSLREEGRLFCIRLILDCSSALSCALWSPPDSTVESRRAPLGSCSGDAAACGGAAEDGTAQDRAAAVELTLNIRTRVRLSQLNETLVEGGYSSSLSPCADAL